MLRFIVLGIALFCGFPSAFANNVTDQFGQTVPAALSEKVDTARQLRLPYVTAYDPEEAVKLLEEVVAEEEDYFRGWFNLGLAYGELEEYERANEAFIEAINIRDDREIEDISIFNSAGWSNLTGGNYDLAEQYFKTALSMEEHGSEQTLRSLYNNIGLLYFYTQRTDEAVEMLTIASERFGSSSAAETLNLIEDARARTERVMQNTLAPTE